MRTPLRFRAALLLAVWLGASGAATARPFEVPTFALDAGVEVVGPRVAAGTDGNMVFLWESAGLVRTQLYSQAGTALASAGTLATGAQARLAADTRGGFVSAYTREDAGHRHLYARRLDASAQPMGAEIAVDQLSGVDVRLPEVLGVPSGFVVVWQQDIHCWLRRYDAAGAPLAEAELVGENGFLFPFSATALDDGGFVVVWHDPSVHTFFGRSYNGDGSNRMPPAFLPSVALEVQAIAPTPSGGIVAAGTVLLSTLRLVEFGPSFAVVRQRDVEVLPYGDFPTATLARDGIGRWLLAFATARYDASYTELQGYLSPRVRPLAADLLPLEPSFALSADPAPRVATALLASGSFVNAWTTVAAPPDTRGFANVVSLCGPDVHVCGDGVLDPRCEECDAGAGNSDTLPDACRTSCVLPRCGDGVADGGEACDDGTASPCDGCDATCVPVAGVACGDGIVVPGCTDQCDDGNVVAGDGCAPTCTFERIPGGGSTSTDCLSEWIVRNPTNLPLVDGKGRMRRTQRCVDDDPACDGDGGTPGSCTFRVQACARNTDVPGCAPAALTSWALTKPSVKSAARHPELAAARAAFAGVPAVLTGASAPDTCAATLDVVVPLRGSAPKYGTGKLTLGATGTAGTVRDKDGLKLICVP
jgi:cysteine-rich repeat protein